MVRYFNDSSSEEEEGLVGEGEEAVKERIAREFHWSESTEQQDGEEEEEGDPLDAFMAGIEVSVCLSHSDLWCDGCSVTSSLKL